MGLRNDLATKKDVRVSALVAFILGVLFFAFSISQLIAVDQSQRQPTFVELAYASSSAQTLDFPRVTICPTWRGDQRGKIASANCTVTRNGQTSQPVLGTATTRTVFTPRRGNTTWTDCFVIDAPRYAWVASSPLDYVECMAATAFSVMVYFVPPGATESETSLSNFDWVLARHDSAASIGLSLVKYVTAGDGSMIKALWQTSVQYLADGEIVAEEDAMSFTVQFARNSVDTRQEYYVYSFWIGMGVIGGAAVVFYGVHALIMVVVYHMMGIRRNSSRALSSSNTASETTALYDAIPDAAGAAKGDA